MYLLNIIFLLFLFFSSSLQALTYEIIDISPSYAEESYATDINEKGQIVGYYHYSAFEEWKGFIWENNKITQLDSVYKDLPDISWPLSINNLGDIVGARKVGENEHQPFIIKPNKRPQFLDMPSGAKGTAIPLSINDHGQILLRNHSQYSKADKVWIWHEGYYEEIKDLTSAEYLTNNPLIAGVQLIKIPEGKIFLPVIYDLKNHSAFPIPFPDHKIISGYTLMVNESGETFGLVYDHSDKKSKTYFWSPSEGLKENYNSITPQWINNQGEILGWHANGSIWEAHLLKKGKLINLEREAGIGYYEKIPFKRITHLIKINDQGEIIGSGEVMVNGQLKTHAFLLRPIKQQTKENIPQK